MTGVQDEAADAGLLAVLAAQRSTRASITLAASAVGLASCVAAFHPMANVSAAASLVHAGSGWLPRHELSLGRAAPVLTRAPLAIPTGRLPVARLFTVAPSADRG